MLCQAWIADCNPGVCRRLQPPAIIPPTAQPRNQSSRSVLNGNGNENTFQKLYARLPEAELYRSDAYGVYQIWLPPGNHTVGKGGTVNWNEGT